MKAGSRCVNRRRVSQEMAPNHIIYKRALHLLGHDLYSFAKNTSLNYDIQTKIVTRIITIRGKLLLEFVFLCVRFGPERIALATARLSVTSGEKAVYMGIPLVIPRNCAYIGQSPDLPASIL